jgi:hypothetical protein
MPPRGHGVREAHEVSYCTSLNVENKFLVSTAVGEPKQSRYTPWRRLGGDEV